MTRFFLVLFMFFLSIAGTARAGAVARPDLLTLETLNYDEVCGLDRSGQTACVRGGGALPTEVPDTVGELKNGFSNFFASCGFDQDGLKCWSLDNSSEWIDGVIASRAYRQFFEDSDTSTLRLSGSNACGLNRKTRELHCLTPYWSRLPNRSFHLKSRSPIVGFDTDDDLICFAQASGPTATIFCESPDASDLWSEMKFENLKELKVGSNWVCARSTSEATCWSRSTQTNLPSEFVTAKSWHSNRTGLCALTSDPRVACLNPKTGTDLPPYFSLPSIYMSAYPGLAELWASADQGCVRLIDQSVQCWYWSRGSTSSKVFSGGPVVELFGATDQPCARYENGQAECYSRSRTLKSSDRVRLDFGPYSKCFWNASGVDCRGYIISNDISFKSVRDVANSRDGDSLCVVGLPTDDFSGFDSVRCWSYEPSVEVPPFPLSNPTSVATAGTRSCAISDEGLTCWGVPYADIAVPLNVISPRKVDMSSRHACVTDDFGFVCWGELKDLELEIPSGLEQPGVVIDFALGESRTCAVLNTGQIQCWGRDYELSGSPPVSTSATSILGRNGLFCALDATGPHCWGGETTLPK